VGESVSVVASPPSADGSTRRIGVYIGQLLGGELVNKALRFAATVVLARALSASDFGLVNVGIAISGIALVASSLGLPDLGARDAAVGPERAGWLAGHVALTRLSVLAGVSIVGIPVAVFVWPGHALFLLVAAAMAMFMATSGDWLARGLEKMTLAAVANAVGGLTALIGTLVVAKASGGPTAALSAFAGAECAVAATLWVKLHRHRGVEMGFRGMGSMLRRARPLAFSSLAIYSYYANLDTIILAATHSERDAGLYSAPYRLFLVLNLVGVFAAYAMLPTLARFADADVHGHADRLVRRALSALAGYGLATLAATELVGAGLLGALFGSSFRAASGTFILLAAGVAWYAVGYPAGYSLIARAQNSRFLRGAATASILNIALDGILIPPVGMRGAGLATMVAFIAAGLVWLGERGLLRQVAVPILAPLTVTTAAATTVVFVNTGTSIAGAVTGLAAILLLLPGFKAKLRLLGDSSPDRSGAQ
jgi:O-antigen/teichoic acid export membrane protein